MAPDGQQAVAFNATRQFATAPGRRYRVALQSSALAFRATGNPSDSWWLVRIARQVAGDRAADALERTSPSRFLSLGSGLTAVSGMLLAAVVVQAVRAEVPFQGKDYEGVTFIMVALIVGAIMIAAGLTKRDAGERERRHDFSLLLSSLADAVLMPAQPERERGGEPQVARVELVPKAGEPIRLGIPTDADLDAIRRAVPQLR